eukprot:Sspe_Gene.85019::Locus_55848_Transcript_1_1_Confidence_1.000_Length_783::g.85019::m.85019
MRLSPGRARAVGLLAGMLLVACASLGYTSALFLFPVAMAAVWLVRPLRAALSAPASPPLPTFEPCVHSKVSPEPRRPDVWTEQRHDGITYLCRRFPEAPPAFVSEVMDNVGDSVLAAEAFLDSQGVGLRAPPPEPPSLSSMALAKDDEVLQYLARRHHLPSALAADVLHSCKGDLDKADAFLTGNPTLALPQP